MNNLRILLLMVKPSKRAVVTMLVMLLAAFFVYTNTDFVALQAWLTTNAPSKSPTFSMFGWVFDKIMFMVQVGLSLVAIFCLIVAGIVVFDMRGKPGEDWQ